MNPPFQNPDTLPDELPAERRAWLRRFLLEFEVTLLSAVYWRNRPPWRLAERRQADSFFLFPVKGELRLHCEGRQYTVPPGQFIMLREGRPHAIELIDGHDELEQISVHCLIQTAWQEPLLGWFAEPVGELAGPEPAHARLREIVCLNNQEPDAAQVAANAALREILIDQLRRRDDIVPGDARVDPRIARAQRTILERFGEPLSVEQLATEADLSEVQFRKLFRREIGQGPLACLQEQRLGAAARMLRHTAAPIRRIALDCGFATPQYFHQCFKAAHGQTPTEYRHAARASV